MPQATVLTHKNGMVHLEFPHNPAALSYDFYSAEIGGGDPNHMAIVQTAVPNPLPVGGNAVFDFTDAQMGIKDGGRGWGIRITEKIGIVTSSLFAEPTVLIPTSNPYKPLYEKRIATDVVKNLGINFTHPSGRYTIHNVAYHKAAAGAVNFVIKKQAAGAAPHEIYRKDAFAGADIFFAIDIPLEGSESFQVVTEGAVLAGVEFHEATVDWS